MKEANTKIRKQIDDAGLKYWQVAQELDIHPTTFTVWLRTPLNDDKERVILGAIQQLEKKSTINK